jgi:hypothetical protein
VRLRRPAVSIRFFCSNSMAKGLTRPVGCEPAEYALKRGAP